MIDHYDDDTTRMMRARTLSSSKQKRKKKGEEVGGEDAGSVSIDRIKISRKIDDVLAVSDIDDDSSEASEGSEFLFTRSRANSFNFSVEWMKKLRHYETSQLSADCIHEEERRFNVEQLKYIYNHNKKEFNENLSRGPSNALRWESWKTKLLDEKEFTLLADFPQKNLYEYLLCPFLREEVDPRSSSSSRIN